MNLADTHCHLDHPSLSPRLESELSEWVDAGISHFIVPGTRRQSWPGLERLSLQHPQISIAIGLHPYFVAEHKDDDLVAMKSVLERDPNQWCAVGEIGLDGRIDNGERQRELLVEQLGIAERYNKPVILHSVRAHDQLLRLLKQTKVDRGVVHAFAGSYEQAMHFIELGLKIGVGGIITYDRANKTRRAIARLPLEAIVLETDAPDMPVSQQDRSQPNTPGNLRAIFDALCGLRAESPGQLESAVYANSCAVFGLS